MDASEYQTEKQTIYLEGVNEGILRGNKEIEKLRGALLDVSERAEDTSEDCNVEELNNCINDMKDLADEALIIVKEES